MVEQLGKRIARLRAELGWTQQAMADRLAISRVAVSHLEMDLSVPSERTITLLAGLFKVEPHELVEDTNYPLAKAERLPAVAARYTEMELQLSLLRADLSWFAHLREGENYRSLHAMIQQRWLPILHALSTSIVDERERTLLDTAYHELKQALKE